MQPAFHVLGIETSCDETAASVVRGLPPGPGEILSNIVFSQNEAHAPYGGVVPEIASRAHLEILDDIIERALSEAKLRLADLDAVAATAGPGLIGGVMVGLTTAKALALGAGKKLIAVNHLAGHALTARLTDGVAFPFLLLLVSGGHCQLLAVESAERFRLYGSTMDDAAGEAFDKVAKLLGLGYPGGPKVEARAAHGNPRAFSLPRPLLGRRSAAGGADFSFSGLKTAMRQLAQDKSINIDDACASFQAAVIDILRDRTSAAMDLFRADFPAVVHPTLVVAGGVAANQAIGAALAKDWPAERDFRIHIPPAALCTDNGAMIAWAGLERLAVGASDPLGDGPEGALAAGGNLGLNREDQHGEETADRHGGGGQGFDDALAEEGLARRTGGGDIGHLMCSFEITLGNCCTCEIYASGVNFQFKNSDNRTVFGFGLNHCYVFTALIYIDKY